MRSNIRTWLVQLCDLGKASFWRLVGLASVVTAIAALHWRTGQGESSPGVVSPRSWEHRLCLRLRPMQQSPAYGAMTPWIGLDPVARLQKRAEVRELRMFQTGEIVVHLRFLEDRGGRWIEADRRR